MQTQLIGVEQFTDGALSEIIRPAAIVPEEAARVILKELEARSIQRGGCWSANARQWSRYDGPGVDSLGTPVGALLGTIEAVYGATTRFEVTLYRVTVTQAGTTAGWTVEALCNEPLGYGGLTLGTCPRAQMQPPPKPFRQSYLSLPQQQ